MLINTEKIWETFGNRLKSYINRRISNPFLAEDILQDIFLKIHSNIDTLKDDSKIHSWIYRIARNTIIDHYRKNKIQPEDIAEFYLEDKESLLVINEVAENDYTQEVASGLREMIEALHAKYAQALLQVEFEGISQVELARKLRLSTSGVKSRVQRGRQMLKDSLMRCCHFQFDKYGTVIDYHPVTCCCCQSSAQNG